MNFNNFTINIEKLNNGKFVLYMGKALICYTNMVDWTVTCAWNYKKEL